MQFQIQGTEQESVFDRQQRIGWWDQHKISEARFLIVGAGAIGNETLKNLVLMGARHFFICDFDTIAPSNLSRTVLFRPEDVGKRKADVAAERVREMALTDDVRIDVFTEDIVWDLGRGFYSRFDVVLGCLDNVETRMAVNLNSRMMGTPWIDAGIWELSGGVGVYLPDEGACYECASSEQRRQAVRQRYSCDDYKKRAVEAGIAPTVQVASALVSAIQVQEAIKYVCKQPTLAGKRFHFGGLLNDYLVIAQKRREDCYAHERLRDVTRTELSAKNTLGELLKTAGSGWTLDITGRFRFARTAPCRGCGKRVRVMQPAHRVFDSDLRCPQCGGTLPPMRSLTDAPGTEWLHTFDAGAPAELLAAPLRTLGIPWLDVVKLTHPRGGVRYWELSADEIKCLPQLR